MALLLNEDERMLREAAAGFIADKSPVTAMRVLRDSEDETGFDRALWGEMADMGFAGVLVDEAHGGVDMGFVAAGLIAEQMGRNLAATPFLSTSVLAATALGRAGTAAQKSAWLGKIAAGDAVMALAVDEGRKHNPDSIKTTATRSGNGFKLNGSKAMVVDGHVADQLIVAANTGEGITLFLVDPKTNGLIKERTHMVDSRNAARITLADVEVNADAVLGEVDGGAAVLGHILNAGRAIVGAEMVGAASKAFEDTVEYIRERKQFGIEIGRFQALQHRSAHLYTELEIARSAMLAALSALDAGANDSDMVVSMAKAKIGSVAKLTSQEGLQMFGGVGMTDEYDIGLYMKRIRVAQELFGDAHYHMDVVAKAKGI